MLPLPILLLVFDLGFAETPGGYEPRAGFLSIQLENDLWGSGKDRHYTHGTKISVMPAIEACGWLKNSLNFIPFFIQHRETALEFFVGQNLFTPDDIEREDLIEYDRPFAGWLYTGITVLSMIEDCENFRSGNTLEISLGVVGPSAQGEDVQREVHEIVDTRKPRGWDNQLSDEPGLVLTYTRLWEYLFCHQDIFEYSFAPQAVAAIGNIYTYLGAGLMLRFGKNLRYDFSPPAISPSFQGTSYFNRSTDYSWYLFSGLEGRCMVRNVFLDGNTFSDSHSVDRKPLVGDFQIGIAFRYKNIRISVSDVFRSKEFRGQDALSEYGAINMTMMY
jgi:hypothetical protein